MRDNKSFYVLMIVLCGLVTIVSGCNSDDKPAQKSQNASDSVDDAFDRGKGALKDVAEGINNAVYK